MRPDGEPIVDVGDCSGVNDDGGGDVIDNPDGECNEGE